MSREDTCPVEREELERLYRAEGSIDRLWRYNFPEVARSTVALWLVRRGIARKPVGGPNNPRGNPGPRKRKGAR